MSNQYLLNVTTVNSSSGAMHLLPGTLVTDPSLQTALQSEGGVLWPADDGPIQAVVAEAIKLRNQGADENYISRTMMAGASNSAYVALSVFTGTVKAGRLIVTSNVASLSAASSTIDSRTAVANDIIWLAAQTTASQNGPYIASIAVGQAAGTVTLTRPDWWAKGQSKPNAAVLISDGAVYGNTIWKNGTAGPIVVDTTALTLTPRTVSGQTALTTGAATVSNLFVSSTAVVTTADLTTPGNSSSGTPTAGQGSGSIALTGTGSDLIAWTVTNW